MHRSGRRCDFRNPRRWRPAGDVDRYAARAQAQMVIAYHMSIHDDGTHMLGPDTYRVPRDAGYYDWRFGIDGAPHPATCPICGRKTDPDYINPQFRVRRRKRDLTSTYDGFVLVSARFREFCESNNWHHDVQFARLPADGNYFAFKPSRTLEFDAGVIEVHHLTPLATVRGVHEVDAVRDLRPLCPNCHTMAHRREPPYTMDALKTLSEESAVKTG